MLAGDWDGVAVRLLLIAIGEEISPARMAGPFRCWKNAAD
jgi:hypothetical protein